MFDAKSLLDALMRGGGGSAPAAGQGSGGQAAGLGGLGDLLGQLTQGQGTSPAGGGGGGGLGDLLGQLLPGQGGGGQGGTGQGGGLGDLLRNLTPGAGAPQVNAAPARPGDSEGERDEGRAQPAGGGGLGDLLGKLQQGGGGGLGDLLGQILGQATTGVKEGAQRVDDATGASGHLRDMLAKATGRSPDELMNQLKDFVKENQLAAGAAAGGLGAVVLGTRTGRSLAGTAVKLGGLALIGGLAYKAFENYQAGRPLLGGDGAPVALSEAPQGSGYDTAAASNESALLYIRAMIAAAAADGRIDADEQKRILGSLDQAGLGKEAEEFLANELNNPATAEQLAEAAQTDEEAVQVFTAARIAVDLDSQEEHEFLQSLAGSLGLEPDLVAHIDAAARAATTAA